MSNNTEETSTRWFKGGLFDVNQETKNANCDLCAICSKKGELLMCDGGCRRSFHFACLNIKKEDIPEGNWICSDCASGNKVTYNFLKHDYTVFDHKDIYSCVTEDCEEAICRGLSFLCKLHEQHPDNDSIAIKINLFLFSYSNVTRNRIRDLSLLHIQDYAMELKSKFPPIKFLPGVPLNINSILKYIKGIYITEKLGLGMLQQSKVNILSLLEKPNFDIKYLLGFNPLKEKPPKSTSSICKCGCRCFSSTNICDNCGTTLSQIYGLDLYTHALLYSYYIDYLDLYEYPLLSSVVQYIDQYLPYPFYNKKSDVVVEKLFHYLDFIYVFFNTISHYGEFQLTKDLLVDEYNFLTKPAHIEFMLECNNIYYISLYSHLLSLFGYDNSKFIEIIISMQTIQGCWTSKVFEEVYRNTEMALKGLNHNPRFRGLSPCEDELLKFFLNKRVKKEKENQSLPPPCDILICLPPDSNNKIKSLYGLKISSLQQQKSLKSLLLLQQQQNNNKQKIIKSSPSLLQSTTQLKSPQNSTPQNSKQKPTTKSSPNLIAKSPNLQTKSPNLIAKTLQKSNLVNKNQSKQSSNPFDKILSKSKSSSLSPVLNGLTNVKNINKPVKRLYSSISPTTPNQSPNINKPSPNISSTPSPLTNLSSSSPLPINNNNNNSILTTTTTTTTPQIKSLGLAEYKRRKFEEISNIGKKYLENKSNVLYDYNFYCNQTKIHFEFPELSINNIRIDNSVVIIETMIRGGYKIVSDNNKWGEIADQTGLQSVDTNKLKEIYYKSLKPIEEAYPFLLYLMKSS